MPGPTHLAQRLVLRTSRGPLAPFWKLAHATVLALIVRLIRFRQPTWAVFVKGSFAYGTPVYGRSDLDLVVVTQDDGGADRPPDEVARQRWETLCGVAPVLRKLAPHFWIYRERDLRAIADSTCLTFGLEGAAVVDRLPAAYMGEKPVDDEMGLLTNPGLYGVRREWRRLAGPDALPPDRPVPDQRRRIGCWAGLQFLWRYAFAACAGPVAADPYLAVKLLADPVRIWLWLTRGEIVHDRAEALRRGLAELPEEEAALRLALVLYDELPRGPQAPLAEVIPVFVRLTERIADRLVTDIEAHGATDVHLVSSADRELAVPSGWGDRLRRHLLDGRDPEQLPLADWRALVRPPTPDETLTVLTLPRIDVEAISHAVLAARPSGSYAVLRTEHVLLFPTTARTAMRCVQCSATDPPSFALARGDATASFPNVAGWSVQDWSRRAVAEHLAWLDAHSLVDARATGDALGRLFTAARAALLFSSVAEGEPRLPLTVGAVAAQLGTLSDDTRRDADDAFAAYLTWRRDGVSPPDVAVAALDRRVRSLAPYAGGR